MKITLKSFTIGSALFLSGVFATLFYTQPPMMQSTQSAHLMTRDAFTEAALYKTPQEVIENVGRPDSTSGSESSVDGYWYYNNKTYDPITGKPDHPVQLCINGGMVEKINYR